MYSQPLRYALDKDSVLFLSEVEEQELGIVEQGDPEPQYNDLPDSDASEGSEEGAMGLSSEDMGQAITEDGEVCHCLGFSL